MEKGDGWEVFFHKQWLDSHFVQFLSSKNRLE